MDLLRPRILPFSIKIFVSVIIPTFGITIPAAFVIKRSQEFFLVLFLKIRYM
jgi:hypothetical protein